MFIIAHLALGLLIGKVSGNYSAALAGSLLIDADHLIPYFKHGVIYSPKKIWKTITDPKDPYDEQRNFLHSFFMWAIVSLFSVGLGIGWGIIFSAAYLGHLILDLLDGSDFYPFYPMKTINKKGPITYLSQMEWAITFCMLAIFFAI